MHTNSIGIVIAACLLAGCGASSETVRTRDREKTAFQTASHWKPVTDNRADVAIVYGTGDAPDMSFERRVATWRERGYETHFMTGIAWGGYEDYFTGRWDGINHLDEGQVVQNGDTLWHGRMVPYLVPTESFIRYMQDKHIRRVIDAGIDAIYLEEPEFWARAGYSEAFKREWKAYYGFDWRPQHESAENTYLSNKLKYHLYYRALDEVFTFAKEYGRQRGLDVRCYVPTHSLVNYSSWEIVSPEASLASLSCVDGYIAQVWTGTSRTPTYYDGRSRERVFENAYLEYGSMESMTEPTGRKLFFLTDPIEDYPRDWADYKINYQATFTAQLLYPRIANYEVMPWPDRIYEGLFLNPTTGRRERISRAYSTQMQVMIDALGRMPESENEVSGSDGICVLMCNSLMFQRGVRHEGYDDPQFSNFYGQTLPLVKRGIPVKTLHLENVSYPETWEGVKVLVMSYTNMKPMDAASHEYIAQWVRRGGKLLYCGTDTDPYQRVREWWNLDGNAYGAPSEHLFECLGLPLDAPDGEYACGKGYVRVIRRDPKDFVLQEGGDGEYVSAVQSLYEKGKRAGSLQFKNHFYLERGPYAIVAVLDENEDPSPYVLEGHFIDLFDPTLPVVTRREVTPGTQALLLDLDKVANPSRPQVLACAGCVEKEQRSRHRYAFELKGPAETTNSMRVLLPRAPKTVIIDGNPEHAGDCFTWDAASGTCLITCENAPEGVDVEIGF